MIWMAAMLVLGIESSCDETACALYDSETGLLGHRVRTQTVHADYGGVVPELASRDHVRWLLPMLEQLLRETRVKRQQIDAVAYTEGPGLLGALLVGSALGAALAYALKVPAIGVHHMEGHLVAPMLDNPELRPPFLALLVSGGHTMLVAVLEVGRYQVLGETLDDAVGEAFDKIAKLMGLGYPGGAALARLAEQGRPGVFHFPRPMTDRPGLDFSFSGLKTQALLALQKTEDEQGRADLAYAFEEAIVETLALKCERALEQTGMERLVVAGGVGANLKLRARLTDMLTARQGQVFFPRQAFCTDNAAMIALAGWLRLAAGQGSAVTSFHARARWSLEDLPPLVV